jgi:hypothetical protein
LTLNIKCIILEKKTKNSSATNTVTITPAHQPDKVILAGADTGRSFWRAQNNKAL